MKLKQLLPPRDSKGNKFFSLTVGPIFKGLHCPGKQAGSYIRCCKNGRKHRGVPIRLKPFNESATL